VGVGRASHFAGFEIAAAQILCKNEFFRHLLGENPADFAATASQDPSIAGRSPDAHFKTKFYGLRYRTFDH
jgi:hypothetical protein